MGGIENTSSELESLRVFFTGLGYRVGDAAFFAPTGLFIRTAPVRASGEILVSERTVFIYPTEGRWEARVTRHGGPHWIRRAPDVEAIREIALQVLAQEQFEPGSRWAEV